MKNPFDRDYFENGIRTHKSLYKNFRWIPQKSLPIASTLKDMYPNKRILDYGCAKGFVVYALRLIGVEAYGYDISSYALKNCKDEVVPFLFDSIEKVPEVDVVFVKDVLEHVPYSEILKELTIIHSLCSEACFVIPLGDDYEYRIPEYAFDTSHLIIQDEEWWIKKFYSAGFKVHNMYYFKEGFKDNWYEHNPYGNGIFLLES